ncbi:MAG: hypothetical protein ACLSE4_16750 [Clostridium sp.]
MSRGGKSQLSRSSLNRTELFYHYRYSKESSDKKVAIKNGDKGTKTASQKIAILEYLTDHASAKCSDISDMLGVKDARARRILSEMIVEGTIVAEGEQSKPHL